MSDIIVASLIAVAVAEVAVLLTLIEVQRKRLRRGRE